MDTERCHEFVVLAQTCNYLQAANQPFVSQSTLSEHIKSLGRELGVEPFRRTTRRVQLSEEGGVFLPFARRIAADAHDAVVALADADDNERRILDIGSIPVMVPYGITELLHGFEGRHRNTRLHITEGEVDILRQMLRKRQIDLAFIRERDGDAVLAGDDADFATTLIAEDRLAAVLPVGHPLAKRSGSARARGRRLSPTFVDLAPSLPMRLVTVRAATPPRAAASLRDGIAPFACQHSGDSSLEPCAPTRALSCYTRGM